MQVTPIRARASRKPRSIRMQMQMHQVAPHAEDGIPTSALLYGGYYEPLKKFSNQIVFLDVQRVHWRRVFQLRGLEVAHYEERSVAKNGDFFFRRRQEAPKDSTPATVTIPKSEFIIVREQEGVLAHDSSEIYEFDATPTFSSVYAEVRFLAEKDAALAMLEHIAPWDKPEFTGQVLDAWTDLSFLSIIGSA